MKTKRRWNILRHLGFKNENPQDNLIEALSDRLKLHDLKGKDKNVKVNILTRDGSKSSDFETLMIKKLYHYRKKLKPIPSQ